VETRLSQVPGAGEVTSGSAVLIVEPDPDFQSRLARMFTIQGHRVVGTASVDGALALLSQFPVDLLLVAEECPSKDVAAIAQAAAAHRNGTRVLVIGEGPLGSFHTGVPQVEYVERPARMDQVATLVA